MRCPTCSLETHALRCPRCATLVMRLEGCSGSCFGCALCPEDGPSRRRDGVFQRLAGLGRAFRSR